MFNNQKGVSLIIVFFVMLVLIAVVLSVSTLLYSEIKIIRNISDSVVSFYAADSGVEKVLYYDRNVLPSSGKDKRGLCYMCKAKKIGENGSCPDNISGDGLGCSNCSAVAGSGSPNGCNAEQCDDCKISFSTTFDNRTYNIDATVLPSPNQYSLEVGVSGLYKNVGRSINVLVGTSSKCPATCKNKNCGDDNGCGVPCNGPCPSGLTCQNATCVCIPDCSGKICGQSDGCTGTCSTCPSGQNCEGGVCVSPPTSHFECQSNTCTEVEGPGTNQCSTSGGQCFKVCNTETQTCEFSDYSNTAADQCSGPTDPVCHTTFCGMMGNLPQCSNTYSGQWCLSASECKYCGDGGCDAPEECSNCAIDCCVSDTCGDGYCDSTIGEDCTNCKDCRCTGGQYCYNPGSNAYCTY